MKMTDETLNLLREASFDERGKIWCLHLSGGVIRISTNGKHIVESNEAHTREAWEAVMKDLEHNEYIEALGHGRRCFNVTKKGYELIDSLQTAQAITSTEL
jgi:hypothetical protein